MGRYAQARRRGNAVPGCPFVGQAGTSGAVIDTGQVFWEIDLFDGLPLDWWLQVYQGASALGPWILRNSSLVSEGAQVGVLAQADGVFLRYLVTEGEDGGGCQGLPTIVEAS